MATSAGAGCTTARSFMDSVHGRKACLRGRAAVSSVLGRGSSVLKRRAVADKLQILQSVSQARQRPWGMPTVTSSLERCAGQLRYHQRGKLCWRRRGHRALLTPFITGTATVTLLLSCAQTRASPLRPQQSPCALCSASLAVKYPLRGLRLSRGRSRAGSLKRERALKWDALGGVPPSSLCRRLRSPPGVSASGGFPKRFAWSLAVS